MIIQSIQKTSTRKAKEVTFLPPTGMTSTDVQSALEEIYLIGNPIEIHYSTAAPGPGDGNDGDIWIQY